MNIRIAYSPVEPHTDLWVNDCLKSDTHGPLSAVSRYPMQSWLYRRGAWPGLAKVIRDIARGRDIDIEFVGRAVDFHDLENALSELERAKLHLEAHESAKDAHAALSEMQKLVALLKDCPDEGAQAVIQDALPPSQEAVCMAIHYTDEYWANRDLIEGSRLIVTIDKPVFFDPDVKQDLSEMLREHFQRPCESVLLLARSQAEKKSLQEEIGAWIAGMKLSVAIEGERAVKYHLVEKYSHPELWNRQAHRVERVCAELDAMLERFREVGNLMKRKQDAFRREMDRHEEEVLGREYELLRVKSRWWQKHQRELFVLRETSSNLFQPIFIPQIFSTNRLEHVKEV